MGPEGFRIRRVGSAETVTHFPQKSVCEHERVPVHEQAALHQEEEEAAAADGAVDAGRAGVAR